ncbi:hypothetical protein K431DRAFT_299915 [Polychaeton citri CBS 116435]|uniref:Uncharacterized protein n=1 Tax=Polychaeton citri CBS 116435 TaxID=1314669 RepID=A0A9P4QHB9_9PEZI|nr:hypothetical protein K431DRAFT_299915 [Polychaeton citri CBS 116435]
MNPRTMKNVRVEINEAPMPAKRMFEEEGDTRERVKRVRCLHCDDGKEDTEMVTVVKHRQAEAGVGRAGAAGSGEVNEEKGSEGYGMMYMDNPAAHSLIGYEEVDEAVECAKPTNLTDGRQVYETGYPKESEHDLGKKREVRQVGLDNEDTGLMELDKIFEELNKDNSKECDGGGHKHRAVNSETEVPNTPGSNDKVDDDEARGSNDNNAYQDEHTSKSVTINCETQKRIKTLYRDHYEMEKDFKRQCTAIEKLEDENEDLRYDLAKEKKSSEVKAQSKKDLETDIRRQISAVYKRVLHDTKQEHREEIEDLKNGHKKKYKELLKHYQARTEQHDETHEKALERKEKQWDGQRIQLDEKLAKARERCLQITRLKQTIKEKEDTVKEMQGEFRKAEARIEAKDDEIRDRERDIKALESVRAENADLKETLRTTQRSYRELQLAFKKDQEARLLLARQEKAERVKFVQERDKASVKLVEERSTNFLMKTANANISVRFGELQQELARKEKRVEELETALAGQTTAEVATAETKLHVSE